MGNIRTSLSQIVTAIKPLNEGMSIRAVSRVTGIHQTTLLTLIRQAGKQAEIAMIKHIGVPQVYCRSVEVDELCDYVHTKQHRVKPTDRPEYGQAWIFTAIGAETKLVPCVLIGKQTRRKAIGFLNRLRRTLRGLPQITTDGWQVYPDALEHTFGNSCRYAQKDGEITWNNPAPRFIITAHVERFNLTLRTHLRRLTRRCSGFSKKLRMLQSAVDLFVAYYNFCRVHETLRVTPALEAGVTDQVWTIEKAADRRENTLIRAAPNRKL